MSLCGQKYTVTLKLQALDERNRHQDKVLKANTEKVQEILADVVNLFFDAELQDVTIEDTQAKMLLEIRDHPDTILTKDDMLRYLGQFFATTKILNVPRNLGTYCKLYCDLVEVGQC